MTNLPLESQLRQKRNGIWSRCAASAKNSSENSLKICSDWSAAADELLQEAFSVCFPSEKVALFALGKLGSSELNLSSDVDLLLVTEDEEALDLAGLRRFQKLLTERTAEGFVFRVDFDLRPGGRHGPLLPTLDQFRDYYGNYGETWERLAFVRLRPLCGDAHIISEVMAFTKKFSFRRHLDFTLFEDLKTLRSKIQGHYGGKTAAGMINLKMDMGGIRDLELFTHALLVVHGGKDESLQVRGTVEAIQLLVNKGLLPSEEGQFLTRHYANLRGLENYVQALNDEQTHIIELQNSTYPDFVSTALKTLSAEMQHCDQIVKSLLGEAPQEAPLEEELQRVGLPSPDLQELWEEIMGQQVLSRHKGRDEISRKAFLREFLHTLQVQGGDPLKALLFLKDFVHSTRAKASFFALLLREKDLMKKLAWLFGHSPYLSRILCSRPELLDSFVYRSQDKPAEDLGQLLEELAEKRLLTELINGNQYLEDQDLDSLLANLTSTADLIAQSLLAALKREFPSTIEILALGKWGGKELGFRSDLDFIFVITGEPTDNDYKVAKRFISRMTEPHRGGSIYSIDMRLRPSGKAGPLVMPLPDLITYLENNAEAWERQAYLKARWITSSGASLPESYLKKGLSSLELAELERVRLELIQNGAHLNLKYSEGGLLDIELAAQTKILYERTEPRSTRTVDFLSAFPQKADTLSANYGRLRQVEQALQLVTAEGLSELNKNHESFQQLATMLHTSPTKLLEEVSSLLTANIAILKELDPRRLPH
ncbi:MAG: glutamine-synthetase adenylyltransferase [Bacillota bacterium]